MVRGEGDDPGGAFDATRSPGEPEQAVRLSREHGQELFHTGFSDVSIDAAEAVPGALLDEEVKRWLAFAHYLRGDPHKTISYLSELADAEGVVGTDAAFMLANQHCLQGDLRTALELFQGAAAGHPLSLAFSSWPYRALGDLEGARDASVRALSQARQVGFVAAESEAHLTLGDVFLAEGDLAGAATSYEEALGGILVTGNRLAECSARARLGGLRLAEARFEDALAKTEEALTLAERVGFAMFVAWCLALRGDIKTALGRLDEAASDYAAAKNEFDRLAARLVAWPLIGLAEVHTQRGELAQARASAESALALAEQSEYLSHRVASHAALARVLVSDDPSGALAAAERPSSSAGRLG